MSGDRSAKREWLGTLALALAAEPDLRLEDGILVRAVVRHGPFERARVWARRGGSIEIVVEEPETPCDEAVATAAAAMLDAGDTAPRSVSGSTLVPVGAVAVLEVDGADHADADLADLVTLASSIGTRVEASDVLGSIVENLPDMVFVKDADELRFVHFNRAGLELIGFAREDVIGRNDYDFFPENEADFFTSKDRAVLASGQALDIPEESIHTALRGTRTLHTKKIPIVGSDGAPRYLLGISRDITDRKRIAERLHQSQKLEAVAQLTAALAHNFNNAAMVISGYAELAQRQLDASPDRAGGYLDKLRRASGRLADLAARLLIFAQSKVIDTVVLDLGVLLEETRLIVEPLIGERIRVEVGTLAEGCHARVDRAQLEQVIINLVLNARDAMPDGGTLRFALEQVGDRVRLEVADTGTGMTDEIAARAFEPFFTTKPAGAGSGLGLFSASEIIERHEGTISIRSEPGTGTTVCIDLPVATAPEAEQNTRTNDVTGHETILLVEDDPDLRAVLAENLEARDYDVLTAADGVEALELLADLENEPIDLLLSDVVMPRMGGPELVARVRQLRPHTRAILVSGYTDQARELADDPEVVFLAKPVETDRLLAAIRALLDTTGEDSPPVSG